MIKKIITVACIFSASISVAQDNPFEFEEINTNKRTIEGSSPSGMLDGMPSGMRDRLGRRSAPVINEFDQPEERAKQFFGLTNSHKLMVTVNSVRIYHNPDDDTYVRINKNSLQDKVMEYKNDQ